MSIVVLGSHTNMHSNFLIALLATLIKEIIIEDVFLDRHVWQCKVTCHFLWFFSQITRSESEENVMRRLRRA